MNLSMCLSRLSLSLPPPHLCSNGGRIFRRPFPAPMALHLEKIGSHSNSFAGSSLSLGKDLSLFSMTMPTQKKYKMKTHRYILDTSVYPREPDCLKELRNITANVPRSRMAVPPDEALFLSMLLKLMNAKTTMEIGVYTGYSLLNTALAIPDDGKILAIDINRETYKVGLPVIEKARVAHKIEFREGPALTILEQLLTEEKYRGLFDFVFVDADKTNNLNYHKRVMELVRVGGVIAYDNSLYGGFVAAPPDEPLFRGDTDSRDVIVEQNKVLAADPQIEVCQLPIADGLTLCRRLY